MKLWRIATETRQYTATDLSGAGASMNPGRWNESGAPVVYCARTISLAVLETLAHLDDSGFPLNRFLIEIDAPETTWARRKTLVAADLPATWAAIPAGRTSFDLGTKWLTGLESAILLVPSVVVPEELVALLNPRHPDMAGMTAKVTRQFDYNRLLR